MSEPVFVPLNTGDVRDDDAAVVESYFIETDAPPEPVAGDPVLRPNVAPVKPTRLMTGSAVLTNVTAAYPLVLPNPFRKSLQIIIGPSTSVDSVYLADDPTKLEFVTSCARLFAGGTYGISEHNGPIWVKPAVGNAADLTVSFLAVIKND